MSKKILSRIWSAVGIAGEIGLAPAATHFLATLFRTHSTLNLTIDHSPIKVRTGTPDLFVALTSLGDEFKILQDIIPEKFSGLLIDAGGYIGTAAIKLKKMFPDATVLTIEPSTANYSLLVENIRSEPGIVPIKAALWPTKTSLQLSDRGTGEFGYSVVAEPADDSARLEETTTVTLAEIQEMFPSLEIGFLKLDIEGAEKALFESMDITLTKIPAVFVELHEHIVPGCVEQFRSFSANRWIVGSNGEKYLSLQRG